MMTLAIISATVAVVCAVQLCRPRCIYCALQVPLLPHRRKRWSRIGREERWICNACVWQQKWPKS